MEENSANLEIQEEGSVLTEKENPQIVENINENADNVIAETSLNTEEAIIEKTGEVSAEEPPENSGEEKAANSDKEVQQKEETTVDSEKNIMEATDQIEKLDDKDVSEPDQIDNIVQKEVNDPIEDTQENSKQVLIDETSQKEGTKEAQTSEIAEPQEEIPSTSEDQTPQKRKLSDTPEDIINLLKNLSPEKLLEIKSKVLEITDSKKESTEFKKLKIEETTSEAEEKKDDNSVLQNENENTRESGGSDVICLDSDDENSQQTASSVPEKEPEKEVQEVEQAAQPAEIEIKPSAENLIDEPMDDESSSHSHLNGDSNRLNLKECINPECLRKKDDEYLECPAFILSLYYIARKPNKIQWVCSTCYDEAVETYEALCSKFLMNETWTTVKIPKKQDLVEIIDSDDEDDSTDKSEIKETNLVIFNAEVEQEVEEVLTELTTKIDIKKQLEMEYQLIESKINKNDQTLEDLNNELTQLERKSYQMYDELYSFNRPKIQRRPSLSLDNEVVVPETSIVQNLLNKTSTTAAPAILEKKMPEVSITPVPRSLALTVSSPIQKVMPAVAQSEPDRICYAIRQRGVQMPHWMPCRIIEDLTNEKDGKRFKIQFCDNMPNSLTIVSGREISHQALSEKLEIGARVIALFPRSTARNKAQSPYPPKRFLPGVIGEKLTQYNKRRYLVFCDYGQVRYCAPNEVREIQDSAENVWDDVHPNLRQFIRDYLESKTNRSRALLNVRVNTQILTERAGNWRKTIVQEVDCSLVKVYFTAEHVSEWLYRGSKRLHAIFQQTQRTQSNSYQRRNDPGQFSYITIDDDDSAEAEAASNEIKKNIAKKSTAKSQEQQKIQQQLTAAQQAAIAASQAPVILNDRNIYLEEPAVVGKVRHFTPKAGISAKKFVKHECSKICLPALKNDLSSFSPLSKPLLSCWERQIVRQRNFRFVVYKAPCGRRLRSMIEVFTFLNRTECKLNVDNFDFDPSIQVLASFHVDKSLCPLYIDDIANGKEGMKINCVNAFDNQKPPPLEYSPNRIPMSGVNINTDPEFMSCCDCTDECVDKSKCSCFQLTIRGAKYKNLMEEDEENISYYWKRLLSVVPTGIYECNSRCKCSKRCLNKVVQEPVRVKMQLYRTKARGWGLQSLHDIPKGTFICIYAGNLYTEKDANALCQGLDHGDEYFAELDLIENAENRKEGYESGVVYPEESEDEKDSDSDYDDRNDSHDYEDGDFVAKTKSTGQREIVTRSSRTSLVEDKNKKGSASSSRQNSNDDSSDDEMVNMIPDANNTGGINYPEGMRIPFRKLYGPKEKVYIMDAKQCGNVGRYFNHSCDPNLFVQSVFVDTHDLRFPWIAFFAQRPIKAGEELTWNYNYEVGSVPSKVLYCKCGSKNCRGRIL